MNPDAPGLMSRRSFLVAAAAAVGGGLGACTSASSADRFAEDPFTLGVASGDPEPDGVVLWTRLLPKPAEPDGGLPGGPVEVTWTLAEDDAMTKGVRTGKAVAAAELGHSVHVEIGGLAADRPYWYRFQAGGQESERGRTRTLPAKDALPARVRFALASCQNYEHGLFTAYEHMLKEDVDFVAHVGDYIYETVSAAKLFRKHPGRECMTLDDYRRRYALYKADAALRAMHAAAPWLVTPDDHEVDNNYANAISEEKKVKPEDFLVRRAAAYQAYYEHQPLRIASLPKGPDMMLYRRVSWGRLADFHVLDTRQYRTDQPCDDGNKPPCPETMDPNGTIMGAVQRDWLFDGLARSAASWNVVTQQVMVARVDRLAGEGVAYSMDQWPGYEVERRRMLKHFHDAKIPNPVVLSGDIHTNWANDLIADFDDLDSKVVASEFVGTSISSGGDGLQKPKNLEGILADNPFVKFHNAERGYVLCEATGKTWRSDYRTVPFVLKPGAPINTRASFVIETGKAGLKPA
ncbi:MAG TPA: alkaline phosphatase D family protein [Planctomycetota bacterium]|nr:alkaline phosphatase D family protein [Planctomycetota bacterium]